MKHNNWFSVASRLQLLFLIAVCVYVLLHCSRPILQRRMTHLLQRGKHKSGRTEPGQSPRGVTCPHQGQDWNISKETDVKELRHQLVAESYTIMRNSTALDGYDAIKTQQKRQDLMRKVCAQRNGNSITRDDEQYANVFVVDEYKFMYCAVRKVASMTWSHVIDDLRYHAAGRGTEVKKRLLSSYTDEEIAQRLKSYKKFMFVREPLQRVFSAWNDKFRNTHALMKSEFERMIGPHIIRNIRPRDDNVPTDTERLPPPAAGSNLNLTFVEFVRYLTDVVTDIEQEDMHWNPYYHRCHPCHVRYDFIGHYETLKADADELLRELCISHLVKFPSSRSTSSPLAAQYFSGIDSQTVYRLGELYRQDYEMFGYSIKDSIDLLIKNRQI